MTRELKLALAGLVAILAVFGGIVLSTVSAGSGIEDDLEQSLVDAMSGRGSDPAEASCVRGEYRRFTCVVESGRRRRELNVEFVEGVCWRARYAQAGRAPRRPKGPAGCIRT